MHNPTNDHERFETSRWEIAPRQQTIPASFNPTEAELRIELKKAKEMTSRWKKAYIQKAWELIKRGAR